MVENKNEIRPAPYNDLDYNMQLTNPVWGKDATPEFIVGLDKKPKLEKIRQYMQNLVDNYDFEYECDKCKKTHKGKLPQELVQEIYNNIHEILSDTSTSKWALLSYFSRDIRLANLNELTGEVNYCKLHLDFCGDCLQMNLPNSFNTVLLRPISTLEISQSKGGFLRRRMGTLTSENLNQDLAPKKKSFFGLNKTQ